MFSSFTSCLIGACLKASIFYWRFLLMSLAYFSILCYFTLASFDLLSLSFWWKVFWTCPSVPIEKNTVLWSIFVFLEILVWCFWQNFRYCLAFFWRKTGILWVLEPLGEAWCSWWWGLIYFSIILLEIL